MNDQWFERVRSLDLQLHAEGLDGGTRLTIVAMYADALLRADKAKRELSALDKPAILCPNGANPPTSTQKVAKNV